MQQEKIAAALTQSVETSKKTIEALKDLREAKLITLYAFEGFDADGFTDVYPSVLEVNSDAGDQILTRWIEMLTRLVGTQDVPPARFMVDTRWYTRDIEFDSPDGAQEVSRGWAHVYEDLKPDKFKFERASQFPARVLIDHPSIVTSYTNRHAIEEVTWSQFAMLGVDTPEELEATATSHLLFTDSVHEFLHISNDPKVQQLPGFNDMSLHIANNRALRAWSLEHS